MLIVDMMRCLMACMQPATGTRATGTITVKATAGTINIPRGTVFLPVVDGRVRGDLPFHARANTTAVDKSWTCTTSGTAVSVQSVIGGARHNMASATEFRTDPQLANVTSAISGALTGGADLTSFGAAKSMAIYESLEGEFAQDLARSAVSNFPAVVLQWVESVPADGQGGSQIRTAGGRGSQSQQLYSERIGISVITSRTDGDNARRGEGLFLSEWLCALVSDRHATGQAPDGIPFSNPGGVQVLRRWCETGPQPVYQRWSLYHIDVAVMRTFEMIDSRTYSNLEKINMDVYKKDTDASTILLDDVKIDMTP